MYLSPPTWLQRPAVLLPWFTRGSSYVEVSAPFRLAKCDWTASVGTVPYACSGIYGNANGFAVTNITLKATKEFNIQDKVDLPVYVALTANPKEQHMYLTFGIAIRPKL